ncbi:4-oxalocrotonate tautomerase [Lysinibacillus sphaericus]|uniref:tautomerase family protein n=1 Tax=Lysinibacillus sphaericus TaxID=1421 RepID=UPI0018CF2F25|nr:tautomerase family protein [Lysinibacillus sphaericus]MBG9453779.1 4-oxalocrotonate tautomerase [Lysinibacillus sphaericus]MBG9476249.1 4-oxalocrotonate tautomerase [Lysinibacillus sphaericus]MBG9591663.1 4-oxalocrotonate tautomerase [Lysinibacillus sphaericus]
MPLIELKTWPTMSNEEKKEYIFSVTELTTKLLKIVPDKIQIVIHELAKENWGKAGAVANDTNFAENSRVVNWETKETYQTQASNVDGMAIITIDIWDTFDQVIKDKWVNQLTQITSKFTHAPMDKVLIVIREMIPGNWGQSGITGADKDFLSKSRTY